MGTKSAITLLTNVRDELNEPLSASDMLLPAAGSNFTNSFLLECLNKSKDRLWDMVRLNNENYFQTSTTISITPSTKEYPIGATDFRQLIGIKVTTSGYEYIRLRGVGQGTKEFQWRDSVPSGNTTYLDELIYDIISQTTLKFADFPPIALTLQLDYIQYLADYILSAASTVNLNDELAQYLEAHTCYLALLHTPEDKRIPLWREEIKRLEPIVIRSSGQRNLRDSEYVEPY